MAASIAREPRTGNGAGGLCSSRMDEQSLADLHRAHVASLSQRTAEVLRKSGFDAVLLHAGTPQKRTLADDQYWPLRPTPHFQHWTPLPEPGSSVIVEAGKKPKLVWPLSATYWYPTAPPRS